MAENDMEIDSTNYQSSPDNPWPETEYTEEEQVQCMPNARLSRVLHLFEFQKNGVPVPLPIGQPRSAYEGIVAIGIVGTLVGKEGLFSQCCWFGNYDLDWFWGRIPHIQAVELKSDIRFRGGDKCVWVCTSHGDYALLVPRATYADMWEETLHSRGRDGRDAQISVWPTQGTRPDWWNARWKCFWPWEKDPEAMEVEDVHQDKPRWRRLGPQGDLRFPGEPLSHLHVLSPWVISPDGLALTKKD